MNDRRKLCAGTGVYVTLDQRVGIHGKYRCPVCGRLVAANGRNVNRVIRRHLASVSASATAGKGER